MKDSKALGKTLGRNQALASALWWDTGVYAARTLASFVGHPAQLTTAQMDRWCKDFDNLAYCDTMSFNLFDRLARKICSRAVMRQTQQSQRLAIALAAKISVEHTLKDRAGGRDMGEQSGAGL